MHGAKRLVGVIPMHEDRQIRFSFLHAIHGNVLPFQRFDACALCLRARKALPDRSDAREHGPLAELLCHTGQSVSAPPCGNETAAAALLAGAHLEHHAAAPGKRNAFIMEHLRPLLGKQKHVVIGNTLQTPCLRTDARVRGIDPGNIRIDLAAVGMKRRGQRHRAQIASAATERGHIAVFIHALKSGDQHHAALVQLVLDALPADGRNLCPAMLPVGQDRDLPGAKRDGRNTKRMQRHGAKGNRRLLPGGQQRIQLTQGRFFADLP